jgi:hypothetical protein
MPDAPATYVFGTLDAKVALRRHPITMLLL